MRRAENPGELDEDTDVSGRLGSLSSVWPRPTGT
jgi:hypothetical protein